MARHMRWLSILRPHRVLRIGRNFADSTRNGSSSGTLKYASLAVIETSDRNVNHQYTKAGMLPSPASAFDTK